jgi:phosphate-selective porin OprO/OprP
MRKQLLVGVAAIAAFGAIAGTAQAQAVQGPPAPAAAAEPTTTITWRGAPQFNFGELTFKPRGRVLLDYVNQDVDGPLVDFGASDTRIRTARLGVEGTYGENWAYKAEVSIGNGSANWEDLTLEYSFNDNTSITIGNFKSVSLENMTSGRYTTFMERGAFNDFIDAGRVATIAVGTGGDNWTLTAGVHGDSINDSDVLGDETQAAFVRATFAPIDTDRTKLHLGGWARTRDAGNDAPFRYRVRNNTNFGDRYTDTGSSGLGAGEQDTQIGLEAALVAGPFSVQGEWAQVDSDLTGGGSAKGTGYYAYASFFPTGEMRNYSADTGDFGRVRIRRPVTQGGMGAIELGLRYDNVDLTDFVGVASAGEYSAITVGATWYPIQYVRFVANYTDATNDAQIALNDVDVKTFQLRAQFDF